MTAWSTGPEAFGARILAALASKQASLGRNIDPLRFPDEFSLVPRIRRGAASGIRRLMSRAGFRPDLSSEGRRTLSAVLRDMPAFSETCGLLADDVSRDTLVELLAYRILGWNQVKLSRNDDEYWAKARLLEGLVTEPRTQHFGALGWGHFYDLRAAGYDLRLHAHPLTVLFAFLLEQYRLKVEGTEVDVRPGDLVIDAGGGGGDTALYFAHRVGPHGRVVSFEFAPSSVDLFNRNMSVNPQLASRVSMAPLALWPKSGETLHFADNCLATRVTTETGQASLDVKTTTLDEYVAKNALGRVGFVKMDIEGAELGALRGATEIIERDRPRLAISAYHRLNDLAELPQFLSAFGYRLFLRHTTIFDEETILFGSPA